MLAMYQSGWIPGGLDWYDRYRGDTFHQDLTVDPVPPGQLGAAYLAEIRRCLQEIREHQVPSFQAGGRKMAEIIHAGHKVWVVVEGHHLHSQFGLPGDPEVLDASLARTHLPPDSIVPAIGLSDGLVFVGYYDFPRQFAEDLHWQPLREIGVPSVWITGGRETTPVPPRPGEIHIDPHWTYGDACVGVPGYPIKILPPSGVVQTAALWMIIGEIAEALSERE
jgi:hypothetical protein